MSEPTPIATLISGGGRTVVNLAEQIEAGTLEARIATVIAHEESLPGVERCRQHNLPVTVVPRYPADSLDDRIDDVITSSGAELVCLCGYLRHFRVGNRWAGRTLNIHPALLPDFGGKGMYGDRVHRAVLDSGVQESGCTVHFVDEEYDHGPPILQRRCPVLPGDDAAALASRVFQLEREAFPEAIRRVIADRISDSAAGAASGGTGR